MAHGDVQAGAHSFGCGRCARGAAEGLHAGFYSGNRAAAAVGRHLVCPQAHGPTSPASRCSSVLARLAGQQHHTRSALGGGAGAHEGAARHDRRLRGRVLPFGHFRQLPDGSRGHVGGGRAGAQVQKPPLHAQDRRCRGSRCLRQPGSQRGCVGQRGRPCPLHRLPRCGGRSRGEVAALPAGGRGRVEAGWLRAPLIGRRGPWHVCPAMPRGPALDSFWC
mmetsp:Transcript_6068/g.17538  ORF Transcript_6068/g.17538 Transcript_6068/m.17538 type:complete len:220 (-) Transcript_6068:1-660(-)